MEEAALADALRSGRLAGAMVDVFETEPLPAGSPLADVPNCLLTPHIAGVTRESNEMCIRDRFCLEEDAKKLDYFTTENEPGYQVHVCRSCKSYIKIADFREFFGRENILSLIHICGRC